MSGDETVVVYVDESGNTGEHLLDKDQPFFSVAAVWLDRELACEIVKTVQSRVSQNMGEPKFSTLMKTSRGRAALMEAFRSIPHDKASYYPANKRYMTIAKLVDLVVEEWAYRHGMNMLADGSAHMLANMIYFCGPIVGDSEKFEEVLHRFVKLVRRVDGVQIDDFYSSVDDYIRTLDADWRKVFGLLLIARADTEALVREVENGDHLDTLDPAIPCFTWLCHQIGLKVPSFQLVHDQSKAIARHIPLLLELGRLTDPGAPWQGLTPLATTSIEFADSRQIKELQIADWIAGITRYVHSEQELRHDLKPEFEDILAVLQPWMTGGLFPDSSALEQRRR